MKPLELVIFDEYHGSYTRRQFVDGIMHITFHNPTTKKRLTNAELAAEYYAQDSKCRHEQWIEAVRGEEDYTEAERAGASRMYEQLSAIHRFATLPHYDEATA